MPSWHTASYTTSKNIHTQHFRAFFLWQYYQLFVNLCHQFIRILHSGFIGTEKINPHSIASVVTPDDVVKLTIIYPQQKHNKTQSVRICRVVYYTVFNLWSYQYQEEEEEEGEEEEKEEQNN